MLMLTISNVLLTLFGPMNFGSALKVPPRPAEKSPEEIKQAIIKHNIYSDLGINSSYPNHTLLVRYEAEYAELGNRVHDYLVITTPDDVEFDHFQPNKYYTLLMLGLDVPTQEDPSKRSFQHWILSNIPENKFLHAECIVLYDFRAAPYKKGLHRIVYLLYQQPKPETMVFDERFIHRSQIEVPRTHFNLSFFSIRYELGDPVAINFFDIDLTADHHHH